MYYNEAFQKLYFIILIWLHNIKLILYKKINKIILLPNKIFLNHQNYIMKK